MATEAAILGRGVYTLADVARYGGLKERRVRTWFVQRGDVAMGHVLSPELGRLDQTVAVSFLDLVDSLTIGELRSRGVSMATIRRAQAELSKRLKTAHPFSHSEVYTDGKRVFVWVADRVKDGTLSEVISQQGFFPSVKRLLTRVEYSKQTGIAERLRISKGVVLDPRIAFGHPVVEGTGVSTRVLARAYRANRRDAELVADLYGVTPAKVRAAHRFEAQYAAAA